MKKFVKRPPPETADRLSAQKGLMAEATFRGLQNALKADPALGKKVGGTLKFKLDDSPAWYVDCTACEVTQGGDKKADVTISMSEADFVQLAAGKLNGMRAYMSGKMKLKGKVPLAQKFADLAAAARSAGSAASPSSGSTTAAAAAAPAAASASPSGPSGFASNAVFERIRANIKADPAVLKKVGGCLVFKVKGATDSSSATWTVDAKVGGGSVAPSEPSGSQKADVTITISDADLVSLASGKLNPMAAYMSGKLKVAGKVALAQKLAALLGGGKPRSKL